MMKCTLAHKNFLYWDKQSAEINYLKKKGDFVIIYKNDGGDCLLLLFFL